MRPWLTIYFSLLFIPAVINAQQPELILPVGHTGEVRSGRFSTDGKYVVTGGKDMAVNIWQTSSGKMIRSLPGATREISDVFFSDDAAYVAAHSDTVIYIWSVSSGTLLGKFGNAIKGYFSPDSKRFFIQGPDGSVTQLRLSGMVREREYPDSLPPSYRPDYKRITTSISPDSKMLCTANGHFLTLRDIETGTVILRKEIAGIINLCFFSENGSWLVVGNSTGTKKIDLKNNYTISDFATAPPVSFGYFSPNKKYMLIADGEDRDVSIGLWDVNLEKQMPSFTGLMGVNDTMMKMDSAGNEMIYVTGTLKTTFPVIEFGFGNYTSVSNDGNIRVSNIIWNNTDFNRSHRIMTDAVTRSSFSPDGKYVLVQPKEGMVGLWDIGAQKIVMDYQTKANTIRSVAINPDGDKMLICGYDSTVKLIDVKSGQTIRILKGHKGIVSSAFFSPDGSRIITNSYDATARLWNANTGVTLKVFRGYYPEKNPVYFLSTGKIMQFPSTKVQVADIDMQGKIKGYLVRDVELSHPENFPARTSRTGRYLIVESSYGYISLKDTASRNTITINDFYSNAIVAFSNNEKWLVHVTSEKDTAYYWDLENKRLAYAEKMDLFNNVADGFTTISDIIFTPGDEYVLFANVNGFIEVVNAKDRKHVAKFPGQQCSVSKNGKLLSVVDKGACSIYDLTTLKLLYSYISVDSLNYLTVDAQMRYDGTESARKLLYYTCGNEIIDLDQFKDLLWVPNLSDRILKNEVINTKTLSELNICGLAPQVEEKRYAGGEYLFEITPRRGGLGETVVYVNGIEARRYKPSELKKNATTYELVFRKDDFKSLFVAGQENPVTVKSYTSDNTITSRGAVITVSNTEKNLAIPDLYAVMVGISDYKGDELDLKYAAKDASDLSSMLGRSARKLLNTDGKEHVFIYDLTTAEKRYALPEKNSIKKILEEIGTKAKANDILLIFFAGHGVMEGEQKQFYFLTADASKASAASTIADVGISTAELTEWMKPQHIKAQKRILIFDACNSGQAIKDFVKMGKEDQGYMAARSDEKGQQVKAIEKLNEQSGLFILSASASNQNAYEMSRYAQGLLTYSLLKAIKEQPDILQDGKYLDVSRWFNAAEKTVSEMTRDNGARQQPQIVSNTNFNIGLVDEDVIAKIVLPTEKPLFTASIFQNNDEAIGDDDLELSKLTNRELAGISARGDNSKILYMTATNSPDVYTLTGRYEVKGNTITVKVNLKQNREIKNRFEISGTKDKLDELAAAIAAKASGLVK